ncbi:MAG: UDP-N-acetylmuramyl-tripeptide synthetase [Planctomycetaceae bacterium]|nr:UDP-N-acetylmuramyl-tripeptide synthetase [Planctomycetaceae bacterium]
MSRSCKGTESVSLKKTLKFVCKNLQCSFGTDIKAGSCTTDAENVRRGDVYFAVLPPLEDEAAADTELTERVGLAIHHGCCAVVADRPVIGTETVPYYIMPNVAEGYACLCQALYDYPAKSLKMFGITGTSGKTSTSYLLSGILAEGGYQTGLIGSLGVFDGIEYHGVPEELTPELLAFYLDRMISNGCTSAIVEVSSKMLTEGTLGGIKFDAVCLTNIRRDHIDYHQTVESYRKSKLAIFKYAKKKALAVCNIDDRITEAVVPLIDLPILSVGMRQQAEIQAATVERFAGEQTFIISAGTEAVPCCTRIVGDEHIYNSLVAAALGIGLEIDIKTVARGIGRVESIPGRMERIECGQNFNVFIDSARTTDSVSGALKTAREVTEGQLICVFGAASYHEEAKRQVFAKSLESLSDTIVLTAAAAQMDSSSADAVCGIGKRFSSPEEVNIMPDRAEAIAWALSAAKEGDTVLIFGKGTPERVEETTGKEPFCDRYFTKQWLYENQSCAV